MKLYIFVVVLALPLMTRAGYVSTSDFYAKLVTEASGSFVDAFYELYADENGSVRPFEKFSDTTQSDPRADEQYKSVEVGKLGTAVGLVLETHRGDPFYAFQGIPFGKVGNNFKMASLLERRWDSDFLGGYDATYLRDRCAQPSLILPVVSGSQDCLHLSVYAPMGISSNQTYPVMVFIHGGAWISGDEGLYIPSKLMQEDVIVVTVQYRLGSLGFLYSGSESAPGNMGLMDQVLSLRWVNKYIEYFGGDKDSITVFGQSAGGASTSWMQMTPQTSAEWNDGTPLLHRVITHSGSALEVWTLDSDYVSSVQIHAMATGCYNETFSTDELVSCMAALDTDTLVWGYMRVYNEDQANGGLGFMGNCPVVQADLLKLVEGTNSEQNLIVIPREPLEMIENEEYLKVDIMAGSVRDEGAMVLGISYTSYVLPEGLEDDEYYLKFDYFRLLIDDFEIIDKTDSVANSFRLGFLPNVQMGNWSQMSGGLVDLAGMLFLKAGLWKMTQLQAEKQNDNKIFFYSFEFESDDSIFDWFFVGYPDIPIEGGITHTDDLMYFFSLPSISDQRELATIDKMTTLWRNFAHYSDPTPDSDVDSWVDHTDKWEPYTLQNLEFLLMSDQFTMANDFVSRWNHNMLV